MIKINENIYQLLSGVTENIYPVILPDESIDPCVVFTRNIDNANTNDDYIPTVTLSINVISEDYAETINITDDIVNILHNHRDETIDNIRFEAANESYQDGKYVQQLIFIVE